MNPDLHVIFGAGQVGFFLAQILLQAGHRVRIVKRSPATVPAEAELMLGDVADAAFCYQACMGAEVVYHCINPEYSAKIWHELLPIYLENLIDAAGSVGARLVVLDNLYLYGATHGKPMNENTPINPTSKKGEIRAQLAESLFKAHQQGQVRAICGRAADFYGPRGNLTFFGDFFWKPALAGKTIMMPLNVDVVHTYHYIPDVAQGLAALGGAGDHATGQTWMLPCQPAVTTRALAKRFAPYLNHALNIKSVPGWLLKPLALVIPMLHELNEMTYQWNEPFIVDDSRFRAEFDVKLVSEEQATQDTVTWAKQNYFA
ncbi:NAD-dependent epimerase/dehydratase family protein [Methylomonas sp. AM2-LC]|uniref:NAD-dependent epimerase/dehydratase family protein n=1 Tax=Methylomonas sp. AM2-LC TaxID=3153301 RepID=UPI00326760A0